MPRRVVLSTEANRDLQQIAEHISLDRPTAARRILVQIAERYRTLRDRPYLGPAAPETAQPDMRRLSSPPYLIFYRVRPDTIQIARVLHGARYLDDPTLFDR